MLDMPHIIQGNPTTNVQEFYATAPTVATSWQTWIKPRGVGLVHILLFGGGGGGGGGFVGAVSAAGGGGGGGSSAQASIIVPAWMIPDVLYISVGQGGAGGASAAAGVAGVASSVTIYPSTTANHVLLTATGGGLGGVGSATVGGAAGAAGAASAATASPLAGLGFLGYAGSATNVSLAGQAGIIGGFNAAGGTLTVPTTGLIVTGGGSGGGLPATATIGNSGGLFTVPATPSIFPPVDRALGSGTATAGNPGSGGFRALEKLFFYGGNGGASGGGSGGAGGAGGPGAYGCGGGGGGAALTANLGGVGGKGGDGLCIITSW